MRKIVVIFCRSCRGFSRFRIADDGHVGQAPAPCVQDDEQVVQQVRRFVSSGCSWYCT